MFIPKLLADPLLLPVTYPKHLYTSCKNRICFQVGILAPFWLKLELTGLTAS